MNVGQKEREREREREEAREACKRERDEQREAKGCVPWPMSQPRVFSSSSCSYGKSSALHAMHNAPCVIDNLCTSSRLLLRRLRLHVKKTMYENIDNLLFFSTLFETLRYCKFSSLLSDTEEQRPLTSMILRCLHDSNACLLIKYKRYHVRIEMKSEMHCRSPVHRFRDEH